MAFWNSSKPEQQNGANAADLENQNGSANGSEHIVEYDSDGNEIEEKKPMSCCAKITVAVFCVLVAILIIIGIATGTLFEMIGAVLDAA